MLSLERYAILRAAIEASGERDRVLADADILPREWLQIERRWHRQLASDAARGRTELAARYLTAFNGAIRRAADSSASTDLAPREIASPAVVTTPQPSLGAVALAHAPPMVVPVRHAPPVASPQRAVPSYLANAPLAAAPAAPPSTGELDNRQLVRPVTPFVPSPPGVVPPSPNVHAPPTAETSSVAPPVVSKPAVARPESAPRAGAQTAYLDAGALSRAPTPFVAGASARPAASSSAPPPQATGTGTAIADESLVDVAPPTVPADLPSLTVDQYAWVSATLRRTKPPELAATLTRLRLTAESRASLEAIWKAHMARYPAVKQAFILALAKHLSPT